MLKLEEVATLTAYYNTTPVSKIATELAETTEELLSWTTFDLKDIINHNIPILSTVAEQVLKGRSEMLRAVYKAQKA